jgi:hypothetical protein
MNPYRGLPDHQFWAKGVAWAPPGGLDPVVSAPTISPGEKVVTMGSCFAQHLARNMAPLGLNYHVVEKAPDHLSDEQAAKYNYGVFSCRFGNVYTTRQAVQLFDRAFGKFVPAEDVWEFRGGFVDPFRPRIEPKPWTNASDVRSSTQAHLECVRRMFTEADWLIFTLGLTEGWRSKDDGAVYPIAPGVAGGEFDPGNHEFVNFSSGEVRRDLSTLIDRVAGVNPACRVILTVSPVPLIATYEKRHVLVSTAASKAALRTAADEVERMHPHVTYFPSYEIITSPHSGGRYFEDDLREVKAIGVDHVMRVFKNHFVDAKVAEQKVIVPDASTESIQNIICDEEVIVKSLQVSGVTLG